jgi:lysophospholipase L1-like esterase
VVSGALGLGLGFSLVEAFARHRESVEDELRLKPHGLELMRDNPSGAGSYRLIPGLDLTTWVKGLRVRIRTNRHAMHWREVEVDKRPRSRRAAFLGDSFAFGCWARDVEHSMVGVFEAGLNRERVEALNFGVGGYGLDDMELLLREQVLDFAPDWVIVLLFTGNDLRDTWLGIDRNRLENATVVLRDEVLEAKVPRRFARAPHFSSPPAPDPSQLRRLLKAFATFRLLLPALGLDNPWVEFQVCWRFTSFSFWSQVPPAPVVLQARDRSLATLDRMDALARGRGARLAVVAVPSREQVYAREESGPAFDVQLPQAWVHVWARERGVPYLDLWQRLRSHALATGQDVYLPDDIHFSERGHALAGNWIREWFSAQVRPLGP